PNLVPGDTDGTADVFVRDLVAGTTTLVSAGRDGRPAGGADGGGRPDITPDGRFVVFASGSPLVASDTNALFDVYVRDLVAGKTRRMSLDPSGQQFGDDSFRPRISADGGSVLFTTGSPGTVYVRNRVQGATTLVVGDGS